MRLPLAVIDGVRSWKGSNDHGADCRGLGSLIPGLAHLLQVKPATLSPRRQALNEEGMIYAPEHGNLAFTVPRFAGFMKRMMP
jgi:hypothetical protein